MRINMVLLPTAEPPESNAFETIVILILSQIKGTHLTIPKNKPSPVPQFQLTITYAVHLKITWHSHMINPQLSYNNFQHDNQGIKKIHR